MTRKPIPMSEAPTLDQLEQAEQEAIRRVAEARAAAEQVRIRAHARQPGGVPHAADDAGMVRGGVVVNYQSTKVPILFAHVTAGADARWEPTPRRDSPDRQATGPEKIWREPRLTPGQSVRFSPHDSV